MIFAQYESALQYDNPAEKETTTKSEKVASVKWVRSHHSMFEELVDNGTDIDGGGDDDGGEYKVQSPWNGIEIRKGDLERGTSRGH